MKGRLMFCSAAVVLSGGAFSQQSFETKPDIHGDSVVYTAEGDVWLGSISRHSAKRITSDPGTETNAKFSPDGQWIAFTGQYEGGNDVYLMPVNGGSPKRLTYDPSGALVQGWTPDGTGVLFRSGRQSPVGGVRHLFIAPITGGEAKELPIPRADFGSIGPNGLVAYVPVSFEWANWFHYQGGAADKIWLADPAKVSFRQLTQGLNVDTTPVWCEGKIFFVSERSGWSNIWQLDPNTRALKQCTFYSDAAIRYPSSDGKRVIFQHGAHLAVYDPSAGKAEELSFDMDTDRIHSREQVARLAAEVGPATLWSNGGGISVLGNGIALGPTGKRILLEARGQIVSVAAENGDMRVLENKPGTRARFPVWSPDGKRFAFVSDRSGENEIWIGNATGGGEPTQLTHGLAANPFQPVWSPDGGWLSLADRNGRILLINAKSGEIRTVDRAYNDQAYDATTGSMAFSPDSKYLTFSRVEENWQYSVNLYEIASGRRERVSDIRINCYAPIFDTSGKYLIYLADDSFDPKGSVYTGKYFYDDATRVNMVALTSDAKSPFLPKNDEEGVSSAPVPQGSPATPPKNASPTPPPAPVLWGDFQSRTMQVPLLPGRYSYLGTLPGKILVLDQMTLPAVGGGLGSGESSLYSFDIDSQHATLIAAGIDQFQISGDGKKLLLAAGRSLSVHDANSQPTTMVQGAVDLAPYSIRYSPDEEWKQVFNETWRLARDFFYDPNMHGLDWKAIRKEYGARLSLVGDRTDLTRLMEDMVSELNIGHAYVVSPPMPPAHIQSMGFLGIDVERVPNANAVRIAKLYRGDAWDPGLSSPLLAPGIDVKQGDYILQIAGQDVDPHQDVQALLLGTTGQTVAIMVNDKPTKEGARVVRVRPLSSEGELRYQDWVESRVRYVEEHGGPNFGYVHIPNMGAAGLVGFAKGHFPDVYKTAMIYDDRYNGGGFTSSLLLQDIAAYPTQWFKPRWGNPWTREGWANIGYKAELCNEYCFSDGELFVEDWKQMKLGPVVGMRTGGGEVGSGGGYELIDHGFIFVPNYGGYRGNEWLVEGHGALPDVEIDQDPTAVMQGKDPQLDRAIELLKAMLAKHPISIPMHPPFPIKTVKAH